MESADQHSSAGLGPADRPAGAAAGHTAALADCDVCVIGGGINGAGIARDLAGRGWRVALVEADDLGAHTSSASTKLVHGGLRYLEHGEFGLVRKALQERERLLRSAPHITRTLQCVVPHDPDDAPRPAWMIGFGLFIYDHLARRDLLPGSRRVDLRRDLLGAGLQPRFRSGFVYADGWVDDARLTLLVALDARELGAVVWPRTRCVQARQDTDAWQLTLRGRDGCDHRLRARLLVNATGPWAASFLREVVQRPDGSTAPVRHTLSLVKGSHIVVPRCFEHELGYLFQNADRRVIFALPYEGRYTLIGTTEVVVDALPLAGPRLQADAGEIIYLCEQASRYLRQPLRPEQVIWSYAGLRPLLADTGGRASALTRDYLLELQADPAPLLNVWGGKLTTFRRLAEEAADLIGRQLGAGPDVRPHWTADALLPGGDLRNWIGPQQRRPETDFTRFVAELRVRHPWLPPTLTLRLARAYGSRIARILGSATSLSDLGARVAPGVYEAELIHMVDDEWARSADDVLWRRSKLGLHLAQADQAQIAHWLERNA